MQTKKLTTTFNPDIGFYEITMQPSRNDRLEAVKKAPGRSSKLHEKRLPSLTIPYSRTPMVSIVAPNYNHGPYLLSCLDSIMFQDYPNIELIIIDDASTDNSDKLIEKFLHDVSNDEISFASYYNSDTDCIERTYSLRYPQKGRDIIYLKNMLNLGSTATYNRGFQTAAGEFCTFVATDDLCHPQFVSSLVETLINEEADFVFADMFVIDDNCRILREFKLPDYSFNECFENWYLCGVATLYRRDLHDRFGWYDETAKADDHECYLRFALGGAKFVHVAKTLYSVRSHATRRAGLHAPERYLQLLEHSKELTRHARLSALHSKGKAYG